MIYEFKSRATGSVVMLQPVAERLLEIIGKAPGPAGIVTVAQLPEAIRRLEAAVAAERAQPAASAAPQPSDDTQEGPDPAARISLTQRAWPLIEMMKAAATAERDVTWGV